MTTMLNNTGRLAAAVLLSVVVLGGCVSLPPQHADKHLLDSMADAKATREELFLKLGEPSGSYEGGRILTYRIGEDADRGYFLLDRHVGWTDTRYSLVLIFDAQGILVKHSLVPIR